MIHNIDKGFVRLAGTNINSSDMEQLSLEPGNWILDSSHTSFIIKCPLFVQLSLSQYNLSMHSLKTTKVDAFTPDASYIGTGNNESDRLIADDMHRTTEALLINPSAYQHDKCERFISQILTPISVYNTLVATGSLRSWLKFVNQSGLPKPIEMFAQAIIAELKSEWPNVEYVKERIRNGKETIKKDD